MGKIKCLQCGKEIRMISTSACPNCGINLSHVKISFLAYVGPKDSLSGYQRSYKLVFFKSVFEEFLQQDDISVRRVAQRFKNYYLARYNAGIIVDRKIDDCISNIKDASLEDVIDVIMTNPYNAIHKQKFLSIVSTESGDVFKLQNDLIVFSIEEKRNFLELINAKLELYFKKINSYALVSDVEEIFVEPPSEKEEIISEHNFNAYPTVESLRLSNRSYYGLMRGGITTFEELLNAIKTGCLKDVKNLGHQSINEILSAVSKAQEEGVSSENGNNLITSDEKLPGQLIEESFVGNKFAGFRSYCKHRGYVAVPDLKMLDFLSLVKEKGFGVAKVNAIKKRLDEIVNNSNVDTAVVPLVETEKTHECIHESNEILSVSILRFFGASSSIVGKLNALGLTTLGLLKKQSKSYVAQSIGIGGYSQLEGALRQFYVPLVEVVSSKFEELSSDKIFNVYSLRVQGASLQEIGEKYELTRERIRQQCEKVERSLQPLAKAIAENIEAQSGHHYIKEDQILSLFDDEVYNKMLAFSLKNSDCYDYIGGIYYNKEYYPTVERDLIGVVADIIGEGIKIFDEMERIESGLAKAGYGFLDVEDFFCIVIDFKYKFYGEYVVRGKKSYAFLCSKIIEQNFPDGIKNEVEDLKLLRQLAEQEFGQLDIPENDRALWTRITEMLVQCGKSKYISPDRICIGRDSLQEIRNYIDKRPESELYYSEIFSEFEGVLLITSNIDNPYFLHGVLLYYYPNDYKFTRDRLLKFDAVESKNLEERIKNYIVTKGIPTTKRELHAQFSGVSESVLANTIFHSKTITQWEDNLYNCYDNFQSDDMDEDRLRTSLRVLLSENDGYCSEQMLFSATKDDFPLFFKNNSVHNAQNLFYFASILFADEFDFRKPHIAVKGRFSSLNVKDIIMDLIGSPDCLHYDEYMELVKRLMIPNVTAGMVFAEIEKDYLRIAKNDYVQKACFSIDSEDLRTVQELLSTFAEDCWFLPIKVMADVDVEIPGLSINEFLVESLVREYGFGWHIVQPKVKDRRYQKGILVRDNIQLREYDETIARIVNEGGMVKVSDAQLLSYLQIHQLAEASLPKELLESSHFTRDENGLIFVS